MSNNGKLGGRFFKKNKNVSQQQMIMTEQFSNMRNPLEKQMFEIQKMVSQPQEENSSMKNFHGAIIGKSGNYTGKAYLLQEKQEVFFVERENEMYISEYEEAEALAGVYYISEYQEYCLDVKQKGQLYLVSGQPLGAGREYYLPRVTEIYIRNKDHLFELA